jgi:hypothetical protein
MAVSSGIRRKSLACVQFKTFGLLNIVHQARKKMCMLSERQKATVFTLAGDKDLWHQRMGHLNYDAIEHLPDVSTGVEPLGAFATC